MKKQLKKAAQLVVSASVGYKAASVLFSKGVGEQESVALGVGVAYLTNNFFDEGLPTIVEKVKEKVAEKKEVVIDDDEDDDDDFFDDDDCGLFEDEEAVEEEPAAEAKEPEPEQKPEEKEEKPEKKASTKKK